MKADKVAWRCVVCDAVIPPGNDPLVVRLTCSEPCSKRYWEAIAERKAARDKREADAECDRLGIPKPKRNQA